MLTLPIWISWNLYDTFVHPPRQYQMAASYPPYLGITIGFSQLRQHINPSVSCCGRTQKQEHRPVSSWPVFFCHARSRNWMVFCRYSLVWFFFLIPYVMSFSKADFMERNIEAGKDHKSFVILILCTKLQAGVFASPSTETCLNYFVKAPSLTGTHKLLGDLFQWIRSIWWESILMHNLYAPY